MGDTGLDGFVLVVDDDRRARELVADLLRDAGFRVITCTSAEEALEVVHQLRPAAVVVDQQLPGLDGHQLIQAFRGDPHLSGLEVLAVSGDRDALARARQLGVPVIRKPYRAAHLVNLVAELLGRVDLQGEQAGSKSPARRSADAAP